MKVVIDGVEYVPMPEPVDVEGLQGALAVRFDSDAADNGTVLDYFRALLETLWYEREGFSGKRPFGNSGWEHEPYDALADAGFIEQPVDKRGFGNRKKLDAADAFVRQLIKAAFREETQ
jgi:hypothetical protein